jgi:hypothetical protein
MIFSVRLRAVCCFEMVFRRKKLARRILIGSRGSLAGDIRLLGRF